MKVRVRTFRDLEEIKEQITEIHTEEIAVGIMAPKALHFTLLVEDVRPPIAIILKETMLAVGGDAAIHRNAITGKIDSCDVLVMATRKQLKSALPNLKMQPFGIDKLGVEMLRAADNYYKIPEPWKLPDGTEISFDKTRVMGIINVTSDSFSGDGVADDINRAVELAIEMESNGADIIDVGGESTRPKAEPVTEKEEIGRTLPVIKNIVDKIKIPISIDTTKPAVAKAAIDAGASIVNNVTGLSNNEMIALCAQEKVPSIIMHMKGTPRNMQDNPRYDDVVGEIMHYLANQIDKAIAGGIDERQLAVDPGIGFGKRLEDNLELIRRLSEFRTLGRPIAIGTSRKSFIGTITGLPANRRLEGSLGAACTAALNGASIIRCHDVNETTLALQIVDAIKYNKLHRE